MFCFECGTQLPDDSAFCHSCGTKTEARQEPVRKPPAAERPAPTVAAAAPTRPAAPVRPAAMARPPAAPARPVSNSRPAARRPVVAGPPQPSGRYVGVSLVVTTLLILGWLIFFFGILGGFAGASQCKEVLDEECSTGDQLGLFFGTVIGAWLVAAFFLWCAYILRLLSDLEARLRSGEGTARTSGPPA